MGLLTFHLSATNTPGEAETDVAAGDSTLADGGVKGVDAFTAGADCVKDIVDIEEEGQATVEEVCTYTAVDGKVGIDLGE